MIFFYKFKILNLYNYFNNFILNFGYLNCLNFCNTEIFYNFKLNFKIYFYFYKLINYFILIDLKKDYYINFNNKFIKFLRILNSKFFIKFNKFFSNYYIKLYEKYNNYYIYDHLTWKVVKFKNFKILIFIKLNFIKIYKILLIDYFNNYIYFNNNLIELIFNLMLIKFLNF